MDALHGLLDDFEDAVRDRECRAARPAHDRAKAQQEATRTALMRVLVRAAAAPDASEQLAAALAEVERVRGRLERATNFSWRNGAVWVVRPEDSTLWHAYEEVGSCGAALIGKYDTLDAAWSAAEAQAGQAAKQGGEDNR